MSVRRRTSEIDLEATDELPVLRIDDVPEVDPADTLVLTDAYPIPPAPAEMSAIAESLRDVEDRLQRKGERVRQLEGELSAAATQLSVLATLQQEQATLRATLAGQEAALLETRQQLEAERASLAAQRAGAQREAAAGQHQSADLTDLRSRNARLLEALQSAQGYRGVDAALLADSQLEARQQADQQLRQLAEAQHALALQRSEALAREANLQVELTTLRQELGQRPTAAQLAERTAELAQRDAELSGLRATADAARAGVAVYEEQRFQIGELQSELATMRDRAQRAEEDLRIAEERILRLEAAAKASASLLGTLQQSITRLGTEDTGTRPALKMVSEDLPLRRLVREEGGADIVHVLGRHTTVGRTPDNDIQIDTTFISRHHAVLLSNSQNCLVEDLNSTNGVQVNGRRVVRQVLHDGDTVIIGNTVFRYQQSAPA